MTLKIKGNVKKLSDCAVGEFIKSNIDGRRIYGFIIGDNAENEYTTIIDCNNNNSSLIAPINLNYDDVCLSYGLGYILEPIIGLDPWQDSDSAGGFGTLALWHDAQGLIFSLDGKLRANIGIFDFITLGRINRNPRNAITVVSWRIWADEEDMRTPGVNPVFEFKVRPLLELPSMIG